MAVLTPKGGRKGRVCGLMGSLGRRACQGCRVVVISSNSSSTAPLVYESLRGTKCVSLCLQSRVHKNGTDTTGFNMRCTGKGCVIRLSTSSSLSHSTVRGVLVPFCCSPGVGTINNYIGIHGSKRALYASVRTLRCLGAVRINHVIAGGLNVCRVVSKTFNTFRHRGLVRVNV